MIRKKIVKILLAFLVIENLAGCVMVSPAKLMTSDFTPQSNVGYVSGIFYGTGTHFGFGIVNTQTAEEFILPFYEQKAIDILPNIDRKREEGARIIEVPVGSYELSYWVVYDGFSKEQIHKKIFSDGPFSPKIQFEVQGNTVSFIGKYRGTASEGFNSYHYNIHPQIISREDVKELLLSQYENLNEVEIEYYGYLTKPDTSAGVSQE